MQAQPTEMNEIALDDFFNTDNWKISTSGSRGGRKQVDETGLYISSQIMKNPLKIIKPFRRLLIVMGESLTKDLGWDDNIRVTFLYKENTKQFLIVKKNNGAKVKKHSKHSYRIQFSVSNLNDKEPFSRYKPKFITHKGSLYFDLKDAE